MRIRSRPSVKASDAGGLSRIRILAEPGRIGLTVLASALLSFVWLGAGCKSTAPPQPVPSWSSLPAGAKSFTSLALQEGDVVRVTVEGATNLSSVVKVQLDGSVTLPLVGELKVLGKTPFELQGELTKLYAQLLKPGFEVNVALTSTAASVYVSGAVLKPGRIPMERPLTVLDAIMEAGGFDFSRAKPSGVTVFRVFAGQQFHYRLDLKRVLKGGDSGVFYLKPFDIVHVPEKTFNF